MLALATWTVRSPALGGAVFAATPAEPADMLGKEGWICFV